MLHTYLGFRKIGQRRNVLRAVVQLRHGRLYLHGRRISKGFTYTHHQIQSQKRLLVKRNFFCAIHIPIQVGAVD